MCVIFIKPAGQAMPSYEIVRAAWQRNPDGGGFVTPTRFFKSMDFLEFYKALRNVPESEPCIVHVRWATHGSVKLDNCHPFYDEGTNTYFSHNGILAIRPREDMTDSETAFRDILVPVIKQYGYQSQELTRAVEKIIGVSKFAMLQGNRVRTFGHFEKVDGILYSNLHFINYLRNIHTYMRFAS